MDVAAADQLPAELDIAVGQLFQISRRRQIRPAIGTMIIPGL